MNELHRLLAESEDSLLDQTLAYAKRLGYVSYSSTLREAWRMSIAGLTKSIIEASKDSELPPELHAGTLSDGPDVRFAIVDGERHRRRGVTLPMFLSLMKQYRLSYLDLINGSDFGAELRDLSLLTVNRFFDRAEIALVDRWSELSEHCLLAELQEACRSLTSEKNKYLTIFESLAGPVILLDTEGRIDNINKSAAELLYGEGKPGEAYYKRPHKSETIPWLKQDLEGLVSGDESEVTFEVSLRAGDEDRQYDVRASRMLDITGRFAGVLVLLNDVTERKRAEIAVRRSRDFYLTLLEDFPSPVWRSGVDAKCDYFNRSWLEFTGRCLENELGDGWLEGVHSDDRQALVHNYLKSFASCAPFAMDFRLQDSAKVYRWMHASARPYYDINGWFAGYICACHDVTERIEQQQQLAYLAIHDPLTDLPNRRCFEEALGRAIAAARRGVCSTMLFMDLDYFKSINDTYGHSVGDEALVSVGRLIASHLRAEDLLARIAGDEFAVLLNGTGLDEAQVIAERIRSAVSELAFVLDHQEYRLSVSIGIALVSGTGNADLVMRMADDAMYSAKDSSRNCVVVAADYPPQSAAGL